MSVRQHLGQGLVPIATLIPPLVPLKAGIQAALAGQGPRGEPMGPPSAPMDRRPWTSQTPAEGARPKLNWVPDGLADLTHHGAVRGLENGFGVDVLVMP